MIAFFFASSVRPGIVELAGVDGFVFSGFDTSFSSSLASTAASGSSFEGVAGFDTSFSSCLVSPTASDSTFGGVAGTCGQQWITLPLMNLLSVS